LAPIGKIAVSCDQGIDQRALLFSLQLIIRGLTVTDLRLAVVSVASASMQASLVGKRVRAKFVSDTRLPQYPWVFLVLHTAHPC
jgi:hypothetical protein